MRVETRHARQPRRPRQQRRLQKAGAELPKRPGQHLLHQQQRDEIQQQGRQHFVHPPARDGSPSPSPPTPRRRQPRQQRRRDRPRRRSRRPGKRGRRRADAADRDLAFGADVDDAGAKAQRDAAAGEQIGRGAVERHADLMRRSDGADRHRAESRQRIVAGQRDQRGGAQHREQYREQDPSGQSLAQLQPEGVVPLDAVIGNDEASAALMPRRPAIQRPICARSASARRHLARKLPPAITAMRSLIASTSSSSDEI